MAPAEALHQARTRVDEHIMSVFERAGSLPMYDMLRYFMGYPNATHAPEPGKHGKRTRSALLLVIAEMFGGSPAAHDLAAALELYHNFTLIHDDIEDHDELRRGQPTVWKLWGVNHAINAGDAQLILVQECLLRAASVGVHEADAAHLLTTHFREVIEGQYLDFELTDKGLADEAVSVEAYLEMIRKKTAVLIGVAAAAGGRASGADQATTETLFHFGESLGMTYQIVDDMVSIWSDPGQSGKQPFGDLKQRKKTYPILYAYARGQSAELCEVYSGSTPLEDKEIDLILSSLEETGAREATQELAQGHMQEAHAAVRALPLAADDRALLDDLIDTVAASAGVTMLGGAAHHVDHAA